MKALLLLITLILFTGCQKEPVSLQHMTKHTRVGIVSSGLDELRIQTSHARAKYAQIDISDMNLDRIFEEKLIKKLKMTNMNIKRVAANGDKTIKYSRTMKEFEYEFKSFWTGLYYYAKQKRWEKHHTGISPVYALENESNKMSIFKTNHLKYCIPVVEPYVYNEGYQSQIRIGYPLIGKPYILFEPIIPMQKIEDGKIVFVARLHKQGYREVDEYNKKPWENGKLELTPEIKSEIKAIILKQMDKVVDDAYANMVKYQK